MCPSGTSSSSSSIHRHKSELRVAFDLLDADRDGKISKSDLASSLVVGDDDIICSMISVADSDHDGYVQFDEFERVIQTTTDHHHHHHPHHRGSSGNRCRGVMEEAFRVMDRDGDGKVGFGDLKVFLEMGGLVVSDEEIRGMMRLGGGEAARAGVDLETFMRILEIESYEEKC